MMHDKGEKTVLGVKIPAGGGKEDGLKVLDILAHHPSTARFISRQLAVRFVADNPPQSLVDKMAKTFLAKDGDLREVMRTMLDVAEFWSRGAFRSKVKSPLEMVASSVRALGADIDFGFALAQQVAQLGEPLYRKQEPTGYSNQSQEWVNSASLLARMNFGLALARTRSRASRWMRALRSEIRSRSRRRCCWPTSAEAEAPSRQPDEQAARRHAEAVMVAA